MARTHHSNQDTYDKMVPDDLKQMATIVASFVYNTAQRNEMIPRNRCLHHHLQGAHAVGQVHHQEINFYKPVFTLTKKDEALTASSFFVFIPNLPRYSKRCLR